jgi:glycosyltransferase involved in cell wall biosynthesis
MRIALRLKAWARRLAVTIGRRAVRHIVVRGFREFLVGPEVGRALVSYLALPLFLPAGLRDRVKFSNRGIAQEMVRALNELGYVADIVNFDNTSWIPRRHYDLFIGHAGVNFTSIEERLAPTVKRVYFSTGTYWREANERLATRLHWLTLRRGVLLPANRAASPSEEAANKAADAIVCIGNDSVVKSYATLGKQTIALDNGVFPVAWRGWETKEFGAARRHFLFFAGPGNVLKGLDLLLEAFVGTDLHLHVCQELEPEFREVYKRECGAPNVHVYGHIPMRSRLFQDLARQCGWVITATCTEGQPGAVLECMGHGLVPVVPDTANLDGEDGWAVRISQCDVETIREVVTATSRMAVDECRRLSYQAVEAAQSRFTPEAFRGAFKTAIAAAVSDLKGQTCLGGVD